MIRPRLYPLDDTTLAFDAAKHRARGAGRPSEAVEMNNVIIINYYHCHYYYYYYYYYCHYYYSYYDSVIQWDKVINDQNRYELWKTF